MKLSLFCISFALISITAAAPLPVHWSASAVQAKSRRHSAISATLPDGSPGIRFCWESGNTPYGEFVFTKPIRLGRFEPCVLRAALHGKLTENFDRIRIRLTDSSGETFQFDTRKRGFHDSVEFEITQEKSVISGAVTKRTHRWRSHNHRIRHRIPWYGKTRRVHNRTYRKIFTRSH